MIGINTLTIKAEIETRFDLIILTSLMQHRIHRMKKGSQSQGNERLEDFQHVNFKVDS